MTYSSRTGSSGVSELCESFILFYLHVGKAPFDTVWIGLSDLQLENRFQWSDGTDVTYTNWQTQEPNNLGNEDCVEARIKVSQTCLLLTISLITYVLMLL